MDVKKSLPAIITAGAALLAFILALFLPGAIAEADIATATIALIGLIFGSGEVVSKATHPITNEEIVTKNAFEGGMSIFGLVSFILLVVGIALVVLSMFKKGNFNLIGSALIALAGVLMFFLLVAGTEFETALGTVKFVEVLEEYKLGLGAILYGALAVLGGGFGILNHYKKLV